MSKIHSIQLSLFFLLGILSINAQQNPYEIVLSGGTGFALSNSTLKTATNLGLKKAGLDSKVHSTWMVNGMIDVAIKERFSVGIAYSHIQFQWSDGYNDTIQGVPTVVNASLAIQKRNYGIRGLYHFGNTENFEIYAGGRIGMTHWIIDVKADGSVAGKTPISEFKLPATYPSIQVIGGFRHYIGRVFGWFGEVGVGTAPYFCSIGISIRSNPSN